MKFNTQGIDAFLMFSESEHNADMYYATKFLAVDPFVYYINESKNDKIIVSDMELGRAKKESKVNEIIPNSMYGLMEKLRKLKDIDAAYCEMIIEFLASEIENVKQITVPYNFSVQLADCIRDKGIKVIPIKSPFRDIREIKNEKEIVAINNAQMAGEAALTEGINAIRKSRSVHGVLHLENSPLKTEGIKSIIYMSLLRQSCDAPDIIVACGKGSSDPHWEGEGELLADEPIVIDMTPYSKKDRYYSDMTRTVIHGNPKDELKDMYSAVLDSQLEGIGKIKAGVSGSDIHNIVCDVLEERGYETARGKIGEFTEGFVHSTGHGVGLDIHEGPNLSESGMELKAGNVITVEPGLYYKKIGGVRLEDVVVVTQNGNKNLTKFPKRLALNYN